MNYHGKTSLERWNTLYIHTQTISICSYTLVKKKPSSCSVSLQFPQTSSSLPNTPACTVHRTRRSYNCTERIKETCYMLLQWGKLIVAQSHVHTNVSYSKDGVYWYNSSMHEINRYTTYYLATQFCILLFSFLQCHTADTVRPRIQSSNSTCTRNTH